VALTVGLRHFRREVLERLFREELAMIKEASVIQEWLREAAEEGEARGEARGEAQRARAMLLRLLRERFGVLPDPVVARIEQEGPDWCEDLLLQAASARSLAELGL
jgi:predicted transposase YdaD